MKTFKDYIAEESTPLQKAETAIMAGDYETAAQHLKQHVPGKSRIKDAHHAKLSLAVKKKLNA